MVALTCQTVGALWSLCLHSASCAAAVLHALAAGLAAGPHIACAVAAVLQTAPVAVNKGSCTMIASRLENNDGILQDTPHTINCTDRLPLLNMHICVTILMIHESQHRSRL